MQYIYTSYGTQSGWTIGSNIYGMHVVDVTKCTKNINTDKEHLGKYDLIVVFRSYRYGLPYTPGDGYTAYRVYSYIPLLNNLKICEINLTNKDISEGVFEEIPGLYGCSLNDCMIVNRTLDTWVLDNLIHYHNDPVYEDATKIRYTDDSYEVVREVLTEDQAKSHAYQNLLNSYGTFYKATEQEITEYYNR